MSERTVGGSNEGFVAFAFAITSVVLLVLYFPWLISTAREFFLYYTTPFNKQAPRPHPLADFLEAVGTLWAFAWTVCTRPGVVVAGAKLCWVEKLFFLRCVLPKFLKYLFRPRILCLWLWMLLLSSVMYTELTFNPHAVLGLAKSAELAEVKRAYRTLSKRYHPDHNQTVEARERYFEVRRAYKALVDRDAFEAEELSNAHSVTIGVAIPEFLTSGKHDGLILVGMLALLFGVPAILWYRFSGSQQIPKLVWRVRFDSERVERFLGHLNIPVDPKYRERRESRQRLLKLLIELGIFPSNVREDAVADFPPFPDFISRCLDLAKYGPSLQLLGLEDWAIERLQSDLSSTGMSRLDAFEAACQVNSSEAEAFVPVSPMSYDATVYLFKQHTSQVDDALSDLLEEVGGNLPSARKLLNLHEEMFTLLDMVYKTKFTSQTLKQLLLVPQRVRELVEAVEREIFLLYKRQYKQFMQQQASLKQRRAMKRGGQLAY